MLRGGSIINIAVDFKDSGFFSIMINPYSKKLTIQILNETCCLADIFWSFGTIGFNSYSRAILRSKVDRRKILYHIFQSSRVCYFQFQMLDFENKSL